MRHKNDEWDVKPITEASTARATAHWLESVHITPRFLSDTDIATEFLQAGFSTVLDQVAVLSARSRSQTLTQSQAAQSDADQRSLCRAEHCCKI